MIFFVILMLNLIGIQLISGAMEWDNVKTYNPNTKEVRIINALGLGEDVARMRLDTPQINKVIRGKDRLVAEFTINSLDAYDNVFNDMEFYDRKMEKIDRKYTYRYKTWEEKIVPTKYYDGDILIRTENKIVRNPIWNDFDYENGLPKGEITIGVFADVYEGDYVEWIPTLYGEEINEWAVWTEALNTDLILYYDFNSTGDVITGDYNLINSSDSDKPIFTTTGALIGRSGNVSISGSGWNISANDMFDHFGNETGIGNSSYSFWVKPQAIATNQWMLYQKNTTTNYGISTSEGIDGSSYRLFALDTADNIIVDAGGGHLALGTWTMVTITRNVTSWNLYTNGTLLQTGIARNRNFDYQQLLQIGQKDGTGNGLEAYYDEMGWWNRTLSSTEVTQLYNDGLGITYVSEFGPNVSLNYPPDNLQTALNNVRFNCSTTNAALNISLLINGAINETVVNVTADELLYLEKNVTLSDATYTWGCSASSAGGETTETRTLTVSKISFGTHLFNNLTTEGNTERFTINFTTSSLQISEANLIFNNTKYAGTFTSAGYTYNATRLLEIPGVTAATNQTVYWSIVAEDGTTHNSTVGTENVSVLALSIDDCTTQPHLLLNFTLNDEEDKQRLLSADNTTTDVTVEIFPKGASSTILNFSQSFNKTDSSPVCISENLNSGESYEMDVTVRYTATSYAIEYYNIRNQSLTNTSLGQNISLYPLKSADATEFLITFKDDNFIVVEGALIDITRKYVGDGLFRTVEIPITDTEGRAKGQFDTDGVIYTIVVSKEGNVLATFNDVAVVCQDAVIGDCRLELREPSSSDEFTDWSEVGGITYTSSFDNTARTVTVLFTTTDGSSKTIEINSTKYDRFGNNTVCTDALTSSSGTLTCTVPESFGNVTIISQIFSDGTPVSKLIYTITPDASQFLGKTNIAIMILILIITLPLIFTSDVIGPIIGVFIGTITATGLLLYRTSFFTVTSSLTWVIIAGGIIIWKVSQR